MRIFQALCVALLVTGTSSCFASSSKSSFSDDTAQLVSKFSVAKKTEVPGATLKPGPYAIRVVDHLSDRVVLQIENPQGKTLTTFLGLPNSTFQSGASNGPVAWGAGPKGQDALRGFAFPGGAAVEFVYPKEEAVDIAKVNDGKVAAVDPASQGLPTAVNGAKLSKTDLQMLNLWLLSTTRVGPANDSQPAVQAERYQAPQAVQVASTQSGPAVQPPQSQPTHDRGYRQMPQPVQVANTQSASVQTSQSRSLPVRSYRHAPPASRQVASLNRPAAVAALPHTASDMPAILLAGILALFGAGTLRLVRLSGHES